MNAPAPRRTRRTARIVLLGSDDRLLLFRYLAPGFDPFWIMPGGECDPGEDYPAGARRELREETGIDADPLPLGVRREADYVYAAEPVRAIEHFFVHRTAAAAIDTAGHTELEREAMQEHRWFTRVEIGAWPETIYPQDLAALIDRAIEVAARDRPRTPRAVERLAKAALVAFKRRVISRLSSGARQRMAGSIIQTVTPVTHDLGAFTVRRAIPSPARKMVGPFIFVDQFGPAQLAPGEAMDVRPHPHINLATVTWLFAGEFGGAIDHRDSLGTFATIRPGQVNLMTAGSGIVHSERSPAEERPHGPRLYGMQTWLALPDGREEIDPAFESRKDLPLIEDGRASARVIMGALWGETAPTTQYAATIYAEIVLGAGAALPIEAEADERAVMLVGGDARIAGVPLALYELTVLAPGETLKLFSAGGCRVMLLGGEAFRTPRHIWWNFVSSSTDRLEQAALDWRAGKFPKVPGDEVEFIPLPEGRPKIVSYP